MPGFLERREDKELADPHTPQLFFGRVVKERVASRVADNVVGGFAVGSFDLFESGCPKQGINQKSHRNQSIER